MGEWGTTVKTRYPGIYKVTRGKTVRYVVSYRVRGAGQRTKSYPRLEEARDFQANMRNPKAAAKEEKRRRSSATLADYFPIWLAGKHKLTPSTHRRYIDVGRLYIIGSDLGRLPLTEITREDVKAWVDKMAKRKVPAPTIDKAARTLRACLNEAVKDGKIEVNPATRIETPDMEDHEPFFLTAGEVDAIAQEIPERDRALVYTLAYTGMRIGEATALRVRSVDFTRRLITISESSAEVGGRKLEAGKTKGKKTRSVPVFDALEAELRRHIDRFGSWDGEALVFTALRGSAIRQNNWRKRTFQPAAVRVGIVRPGKDGKMRPPRVHDLRHTFASLAQKDGYSLHELKTMLGHSTITLTSDLYAHLFQDDIARKAEGLGKTMREARNGGTLVKLARAE